jgi:hypothetical protein
MNPSTQMRDVEPVELTYEGSERSLENEAWREPPVSSAAPSPQRPRRWSGMGQFVDVGSLDRPNRGFNRILFMRFRKCARSSDSGIAEALANLV